MTTACIDEVKTDRELAEALARGDPDAVDGFYETHVDAIYTFAYFRMGRRQEDAEDVTSETFLTALRSIGSYEGRSPLGAWLRGIARNKCRERNKAKARAAARGIVPLDPESAALAHLDAAPLPDSVLASLETRAAVSATLAQIPERYRRALLCKYVDEMTFAEIGLDEGCSAKAAESLVQRAKTAFARMLETVTGAREARTSHG